MRISLGKSGWAHIPANLSKRGWPRFLRNWTLLIERCDDPEEAKGRLKDVAYWYGERALTGLLAAAAWQTRGWWALETSRNKTWPATGTSLQRWRNDSKRQGRGFNGSGAQSMMAAPSSRLPMAAYG
jgi:hypothetical protein